MNDNKVLATVDGRNITEQDAYNFLNQLSPQVAMQFRTPEGIKNLVKELVNQELFYSQAIAEGLDKEEEFIEQLEKIKKQVLIQYTVNKLLSAVEVKEEEIKAFYMSKQENFKTPEMVRASHILVDSEEDANSILEEINNGMALKKQLKNIPTVLQKKGEEI